MSVLHAIYVNIPLYKTIIVLADCYIKCLIVFCLLNLIVIVCLALGAVAIAIIVLSLMCYF